MTAEYNRLIRPLPHCGELQGFREEWRPRIHKPPRFKGLNIRIPITIRIKGRELVNQESTLGF